MSKMTTLQTLRSRKAVQDAIALITNGDDALQERYFTNEKHLQFIADMIDAGFVDLDEESGLRHYKGRYYYEGPAVVWGDLQQVIRATDLKLQWDNMAYDYVIYPK